MPTVAPRAAANATAACSGPITGIFANRCASNNPGSAQQAIMAASTPSLSAWMTAAINSFR